MALQEASAAGMEPWELLRIEADYAVPVTQHEDYEARLEAAKVEARQEVMDRVVAKRVAELKARLEPIVDEDVDIRIGADHPNQSFQILGPGPKPFTPYPGS